MNNMPKSKPHFNLVIAGSFLIIVCMIYLIISGYLLNITAGWPMDFVFYFYIWIALGFGIVVPSIIILLNQIGSKRYEKHGLIPNVFGVITLIVNALLIVLAIFHFIRTYSTGLLPNPEYTHFYIVILGSIVVGVLGALLGIIGSIKNIRYSSRG